MRGVERRTTRVAAIVALVALLAVPVALSRHLHGHAASGTCATCVVAHHSVAVATPTLLPGVTVAASFPLRRGPVLLPVSFDRSPHAGRAPPVLVSRTIG